MAPPTLLCVPIAVHDAETALADAREARLHGADLVEYRIDQFFTGQVSTGPESAAKGGASWEEREILRMVAESPLPCIVTCRPAEGEEGGYYEGPEEARIALLERLATAFGPGEKPPRYIDVELCAYLRSPAVRQRLNLALHHPERLGDLRTSLILSVHDFLGRPRDLTRKVLRMQEAAEAAEAAVCKVAYRCRSVRDNLELLDLPREMGRPTIALGIGEYGLMSRVLAPKFGGFLTFAALRAGGETAPGQPTIRELLCTYHFRSIRESTAVYGLIGWPVAHSLSPLVHNAGFHTTGIDAVYVPLPVPPGYEHFKATVLSLIDHRGLDFRGCSVTTPHKENLLRLAEELRRVPGAGAVGTPPHEWEIDASAAACGAANTLVIEREEGTNAPVRAVVMNTDGAAAAACLAASLGDLAAKRVAIVGAGGAARAIASALLMADATVVVYNRTRERAEGMVEDLRRRMPQRQFGLGRIGAGAMTDLARSCCDAYVNCTPVGMASGPDPEGAAIPVTELADCGAETVVMDTVYNPVVTPLLRLADAAGLRTIDGLAMFIRQAAGQFEAWTGKGAPLGLFELIAREAVARPVGA